MTTEKMETVMTRKPKSSKVKRLEAEPLENFLKPPSEVEASIPVVPIPQPDTVKIRAKVDVLVKHHRVSGIVTMVRREEKVIAQVVGTGKKRRMYVSEYDDGDQDSTHYMVTIFFNGGLILVHVYDRFHFRWNGVIGCWELSMAQEHQTSRRGSYFRGEGITLDPEPGDPVFWAGAACEVTKTISAKDTIGIKKTIKHREQAVLGSLKDPDHVLATVNIDRMAWDHAALRWVEAPETFKNFRSKKRAVGRKLVEEVVVGDGPESSSSED